MSTEASGGQEQGSASVKLNAGADLRALLMVGSSNNGKTRGGNRGRAKKSQNRISYDKDVLIAIGKNAASQKRPEFLDPEYDTKPSQSALAMGANPQPRWDPEKWHSNTKPKRQSNTSEKPSPLAILTGNGNKENSDWRKEEQQQENQPEQRLGPQRRSFAGGKKFRTEQKLTIYLGCKPAARTTSNEPSEIILGPKRGGNSNQAEKETRAWRPSHRRENDDDKFKDFRSEKPGHQRYSAAEKFGGNYRQNRRNNWKNHSPHHSDDEVPEWMTDGPDTINEVLNLDDCRLPKDQRKNRPEQSDSPELVAFDPSTWGQPGAAGGGLEDELGGLEDDLPKDAPGLEGFHSKELDDLLDQIDSDDGGDVGVSRFQSMFNKPQAPSAIDALQQPRSELGARVLDQRRAEIDPGRRLVDPSVWGGPAQQQQPPPPPPTHRPLAPPHLTADPAVLDMRSLQGILCFTFSHEIIFFRTCFPTTTTKFNENGA